MGPHPGGGYDRRVDLSLSIWKGHGDGPFSGVMGELDFQVEVMLGESMWKRR